MGSTQEGLVSARLNPLKVCNLHTLPTKRDVFCFASGFMCGMFLAPIMSIHAQVATATTSSLSALPAPDSGTAGVLTKFFTDLARRFWGGDKAVPEWVPLTMASILGPIIVALITMASGIPVTTPETIAKVVLGGFIAGTGVAVLLTQAHSASHAPDVNLPPVVASLPTPMRQTLCCTHGDCTNSQAQAQTMQAQASGVSTSMVPTPSNVLTQASAPTTQQPPMTDSSIPPPMRR